MSIENYIAFSKEYSKDFPILFDHQVLEFNHNKKTIRIANAMSFTHPERGLKLENTMISEELYENVVEWFKNNGNYLTNLYCEIIGELFCKFFINCDRIFMSDNDCNKYIQQILSLIKNEHMVLKKDTFCNCAEFIIEKIEYLYNTLIFQSNESVQNYLLIKKINKTKTVVTIINSFNEYIIKPIELGTKSKCRFDKMFQAFGTIFGVETFGGYELDSLLENHIYKTCQLKQLDSNSYLPSETSFHSIIKNAVPENGYLLVCESGNMEKVNGLNINSINKLDEMYSVLSYSDSSINIGIENNINETEYTIVQIEDLKIALLHLNSNGIDSVSMVELIKNLVDQECNYIVGDTNITNNKIIKMDKKLDDEFKGINKDHYWKSVKDMFHKIHNIEITFELSTLMISKKRIANNIFLNNQVNKGGDLICEDDGMVILKIYN